MSIYRYINPRLRARILAGDVPEYVTNSPRGDYIRQCVLSAPPWCDRARVREMMVEAAFKTKAFGVPYVLGHIIPITSDFVSGLTVSWNLRVMTKVENDAMGNKLHVSFQADLFEEPEQLALL